MKILQRLRIWLEPPVFAGDEDKTRVTRILNTVLLILLGFVVIAGPLVAVQTQPLLFFTVILFFLILGMRYYALRRGYVQHVSFLLTFLAWTLSSLLGFSVLGASGIFFFSLFMSVTLAYVLLSRWWGLGFMVLSIGISLVVLYFDNNGMLLNPARMPRNAELVGAIMSVLAGSLLLYLQSSGLEQALDKSRANTKRFEAQSLQLEKIVAERTAVLARRAQYLEVTANIARETAGMLSNPDQMFSLITRLISRQLGFYHTGLFLIDPNGEWAILRAASSEGGQRMLARNHRLRVGEQGIVGFVAEKKINRIALDVGVDAVFFNNVDLPETRSEIALPLIVRDDLIGVLDVQSRESAAFDSEGVVTLQVLADQVAVAVDNVRLFQQQQQMINLERQVVGDMSRLAWRDLLHTERNLAFVSDEKATSQAGDVWRPEMERAFQSDEVVIAEKSATSTSAAAVPIHVRGQIVGVVGGRKTDQTTTGDPSWSDDELSLLKALVEQLELSLESARLYRDAQKLASREHTIGAITSRVRESLDTETILEVAATEIRKAMGLERIVVRLGAPGDNDPQV